MTQKPRVTAGTLATQSSKLRVMTTSSNKRGIRQNESRCGSDAEARAAARDRPHRGRPVPARRHRPAGSVGVGPLPRILQDFSGLGVDADLVRRTAQLDIEGIAETASAAFLLQLLGRDP